MTTIYQEMEAAGLVEGSRYSDMYVFDTPEAREIMKRHGITGSSFKSNIDGKQLIEIPLAFDPYWEQRGCNLIVKGS